LKSLRTEGNGKLLVNSQIKGLKGEIECKIWERALELSHSKIITEAIVLIGSIKNLLISPSNYYI
jgi:hypothetical protein